MRKRNTLYTANKWNKPLFIPEENLFFDGGTTLVTPQTSRWTVLAGKDKKANPWDYMDDVDTTAQYMQQKGGLFNMTKAANPFSKGNIGNTAAGLSTAVAPIAGNLISDGYNSGAGNTIGTVGSMAGTAISTVNPVAGAVVNLGSQVVGGLVNRAFGTKVDEARLNAAKQGTAQLNSFTSNAGSFDDIHGVQAVANVQDAYKDGWFSNKAGKKNEELRQQRENALAFAQNSIINNVNNISEDQLNNALANYSALGGPIDIFGNNNDMGAIQYGLMADYLNTKKKQAEQKNQMTNMFMGTPKSMFDFGGTMQTNSSDFSTGLTHINAGGSHEESPYDGVQMGVDQNGVPNLVEENETVWNDYVFSNRIMADEATKQLFHLPKKKDITFADISKKLEKEIKERPNDPISEAGFKAQMQTLEEQQERQKQEMEAERAKAAFEALSPEEQVAVMENAAQQEQMAQEAAMQQEAMAQQQAQPSPEEQAMMQQQMMQADGSQAMVGQEAPMMAEGGHLYKGGGDKKKNVGTWKNDKENHWDVFTKPGLKRYIDNIKQRLAMAPDDETKAAIRKEAMNELNTLQQSYYDYVREGAADAVHGYDDNILNHQKMFDRLYGNTGFYTTDENGNVRNLIADAINLPNGAATDDKPDNWFDGYNGPRTSIRNFGSTAYGDDKYYQDLVDEFKGLGLTYAPNDNWKDDNGILYGLSLPEEEAAKEAAASAPKSWDWSTGSWIDRTPAESVTEIPATTPSKTQVSAEDKREIGPRLKAEWPRYAGLFGPAVGLGMMAAGVGRPDTSLLDAAIEGSGNVALADTKYLGDYERYTPLDRMFHTNQLMANARATDRALTDTVSPSKAAGLLANGYNTTIGLGNLARQSEEYNDALYHRTKEFNRGTNQYNADAYNRLSQFNAEAINRANQQRAGLSLQAAKEKMDADAGWYNGLYGNVAGLFKGIGDLGRENAQHNMVARMWADGLAGTATPDTYTASDYLDWTKRKRAKGGKNRKKHDSL